MPFERKIAECNSTFVLYFVDFTASNLRTLLEKRKSSTNKLEGEAKSSDEMNMLSVEDMVNLLHESDVLTKSLEEQIVFYQVLVLVMCVCLVGRNFVFIVTYRFERQILHSCFPLPYSILISGAHFIFSCI